MCIVYSVWCGCGPLASAVSAMRSICLWVMECTHTGVWRRHTTMANILPDNNDAKARLTPTLLVQLSSSLSTLSLVFDDVTTQYAFAHHAVCHHYRTNSNANLVLLYVTKDSSAPQMYTYTPNSHTLLLSCAKEQNCLYFISFECYYLLNETDSNWKMLLVVYIHVSVSGVA